MRYFILTMLSVLLLSCNRDEEDAKQGPKEVYSTKNRPRRERMKFLILKMGMQSVSMYWINLLTLRYSLLGTMRTIKNTSLFISGISRLPPQTYSRN